MDAERRHFVYGSTEPGRECPGCVNNGISAEVANSIYDEMSSFASYAFNKSHAACYAVVAYQTAYLKCHYPCQFMAALLTSVLDNTNKVIQYTAECSRLGIRLLAPDINESDVGFTVQGGDIRFGLLALKNVGRNLIEAVVRARTLNGPYQGLYDFCKRMHGTEINRRAVESLVKAGAFDSFAPSRRASLEALEGILKSVENDARRNLDGQMDLFGAFSGAETQRQSYTIPEKEEYPVDSLLQMEKEVSGLYLSGHPLDQYREEIEHLASHKVSQLTGEDARRHDGEQVVIVCSIVRIKTINTRSGGMMAFLTVEDLTGTMEVLVFPKTLQACAVSVRENAAVVIRGRVSYKEDEASKLLADHISLVDEYGKDGRRKVDISNKNTKDGLWLKLPSMSGDTFSEVENLLEIFEGDFPVYMHFEDTGKTVLAPRRMWCVKHELLLEELGRILGGGGKNVKVR